MGKRKLSPDHFARGLGKSGWVYVARNNMHRDDVYKVGYTEKTPEVRVAGLNTEQRNRTSQIGFFSLMYACAVLDAQGCEQALFDRVGRLLESERKEFVNAPLEVIVGELLHIQKADNNKVRSTAVCLHCREVMNFCPLPQAIQQCQNCGNWFKTMDDASPSWTFDKNARKKSYKPKPSVATARSPLAKAFIRLQSAVKHFAWEGVWTEDEFLDEIEGLLAVNPEFDREVPDSRPNPLARQPRQRTPRTPRSRKGWMDCPDCLSSIQIHPNEPPECLECNWKMPDDQFKPPIKTSSHLVNLYGGLNLRYKSANHKIK